MTARERRILLLGGLIVGALAIVSLVSRAAKWRAATEERNDVRSHHLAAMEGMLATVPSLELRARQLQDGLKALAPDLLGGDSRSAAEAALAVQVNAVASRSQVRVVRQETIADSSRIGALSAVILRAELEGDTRGVFRTLASLVEGQPAIELVSLRIEAADPASAPDVAEVLRTECSFRGWFLERRP